MLEKNWTLLGSRSIADYEFVRIREDQYRFEPSGLEAPFVVCDCADWVLVIPLTPGGQVVFVRQFRHGVQRAVLEIPGGIMDDNETPEQTARRELLEETGFSATSVRLLGTMLPNPAIHSASCHVVLAEGCCHSAEPALDPLENIDVVLRPMADVPAMIRRGELCHALVIAAFALRG